MSNVLRETDGFLGKQVYKINNLKIYRYGDTYKMLYFKNPTRSKGFEEKKPRLPIDDSIYPPLDMTADEWVNFVGEKNESFKREKILSNVRRAKNTVYELAMCNDWSHFGTFTIDGTKWNRQNLEEFYKAFAKWLNNYNNRRGANIKYLLIPELHKDQKNWHMHGLVSGIPEDKFSRFEKGLHPTKLVESEYLNWGDYEKKFGFCSFGAVRSKESVSAYITKYITKQLSNGVIEVGKHLYYCSKGLARRELVYDAEYFPTVDEVWDFENDFVCVKTIRGDEV